MGTIAKPPLLRMTAAQLVIFIALGFAALLHDQVIAYSLMIGGLIQLVGSAYFARLAFRYQGASQIHRAVQAMYRGETGKIVLSAALFALAYTMIKPLDPVAVFVGYAVMVVIHLLTAANTLKLRRH